MLFFIKYGMPENNNWIPY